MNDEEAMSKNPELDPQNSMLYSNLDQLSYMLNPQDLRFYFTVSFPRTLSKTVLNWKQSTNPLEEDSVEDFEMISDLPKGYFSSWSLEIECKGSSNNRWMATIIELGFVICESSEH